MITSEMGKRDDSLYKNMRKKHNYIKGMLIKTGLHGYTIFSRSRLDTTPVSLLDVSVGRFGDMHKYVNSIIGVIVGIDPDENSIEEARRRFENLPKSSRVTKKNVILKVAKITDKDVDIPKPDGIKLFDVVTCNFTLHYFFESKEMLETAIKNIAKNLKDGGLFIGTTIDGKAVREHCERIGDMNTTFYKIEMDDINEKGLYGNGYRFKLLDVGDSGLYFNDNDQKEYLVDMDEFRRVCENNGLLLDQFSRFDTIRVPFDTRMKEYEEYISKMYYTFAFRKVTLD